jgi:hypothetical protein
VQLIPQSTARVVDIKSIQYYLNAIMHPADNVDTKDGMIEEIEERRKQTQEAVDQIGALAIT